MPATNVAPVRTPSQRTILMCRPEFFTVSYRINPWMHPEDPTDTSLAVKQWEVLYQTYLDLGFDMRTLPGHLLPLVPLFSRALLQTTVLQ